MNHVTVIAEPGCLAEGSYERALELLQCAYLAGADVFKPQWTSSAARMVERRRAPAYLRCYQWLQTPIEDLAKLADNAHARGMKFACSVYLPEDVAIVAPYVDFLKISSFEAEDECLREAADASGVDYIVSSGMTGRHAFARLNHALRGRYGFLHCVSSYPAMLESLNLAVLQAEQAHRLVDCESQPSHIGLSDHSRDVLTGAVAVGAGATILEAHYRLDSCDPQNPDYAVAFSPAEFTQYIQNVRKAERMMGDGVKKIEPCEQAMLRYKVTN